MLKSMPAICTVRLDFLTSLFGFIHKIHVFIDMLYNGYVNFIFTNLLKTYDNARTEAIKIKLFLSNKINKTTFTCD